uniref:Multidrug resistance-associated protein lethal(2)03659 n=1 Tax=Timema tahoe TaxID=61484 RepID=A0A7R9IHU0_9NEOP|nr:unnamed protein product [Timema tahoe]
MQRLEAELDLVLQGTSTATPYEEAPRRLSVCTSHSTWTPTRGRRRGPIHELRQILCPPCSSAVLFTPRYSTSPLTIQLSVCFRWMLKIFWKGYKKDLEMDDLFVPLDEHKSDYLGNKFEKRWNEELSRASKEGRQPSLLRVIMRCFGLSLMGYGLILAFLEIGLRASQPLFLGRLIQYFSPSNENITLEQAYIYALGVIMCSTINVFAIHPYMMAIFHMGMKIRVACCSLIYRKSLRLSKTALGQTTAGQVVNLLSNDVSRFDICVIFIHYLWLGPLETVVATYFMWNEVGVSAVIGVAALLMFIPLQAYLGKKTSDLRMRTAIRTDERVRLMNEIISGIQVIKMYTWEVPFNKLVELARKREIDCIRATSYIRGIILSFIMFTTRISIFLSILAYVLLGNNITAEKVFVLTSYYNILRQTMTVFFPQGITQVAEARVSVQRLQKFLLYEETQIQRPISCATDKSDKNNGVSHKKKRTDKVSDVAEKVSEKSSLLERHDSSTGGESYPGVEVGIRVVEATARWLPDSAEPTLDKISLTVHPGRLLAVIGPVGSGKSSLLQMMLKELPLSNGKLSVNGKISYASQEPWLFAGSVRQNILFGQPYVRERYSQVVRVCALKRDFQLLPYGDRTIVGERGVSLSGGQRARINLARAVYMEADIYLLDDPLSAVDTHVGKHLFEDCISNFLRDKACLLITHQLQYLKQVDHIVILNYGKIEAEGTYYELQATGLNFAKLLEEDHETEEDLKDPVLHPLEPLLKQISFGSASSIDDRSKVVPVEVAEEKTTGRVGGDVYAAYLRAGGNCSIVFFLFCMCFLAQFLASCGDYWITKWTNLEEMRYKSLLDTNSTVLTDIVNTTTTTTPVTNSTFLEPDGDLSTEWCIYVYAAITIATIVISLGRSFLFFTVCMRASQRLHNAMFDSITRATMWFFNNNPSGRILNRFSKDMGSIDEMLPQSMIDCLQIGLSMVAIITVVAIVNPWLLLPTFVVGVIFYMLRVVFLATSRSVKRLEGVTRSPVFSHLNASIQGLTTIRAFGAQEILEKEFDNHQDLHSSAWYLFIASSRTFGFWLDIACLVYIVIVTLSFLVIGGGHDAVLVDEWRVSRHGINPLASFVPDEFGGNVGLAITQAIGLTGMCQWGMRQSAELENQMTSVERILEYTKIEREPALESPPDKKPPKEWPQNGTVKFQNLFLKYNKDEGPVLNNLNFIIESKQKVGIVGRTGAGKSSLISALFRLAPLEGKVWIDGIDTSSIGLHDLRSKISIIPQEPVLFSGTMRKNLDPFDEYSDEILWQSLDEVELKEAVADLPSGLSSVMSEGGSNFSVGQRQLVCLARAIVKNNRILVLDEATANVDPQTDALIQHTIRRKFEECTVLTIAHRLHTVMDSDRVLVMDAGTMVEFDHPRNLLSNPQGYFSQMVEQTGSTMETSLRKVAEEVVAKGRVGRDRLLPRGELVMTGLYQLDL